MMKMSYLTGCLVVLTAAAPLVRADEQSHRRAAEELLQAMGMDKQLQSALDQTLALQIKAQPVLLPYRDVMRKFLGKHISYAALKDDLIKIYSDEFSETELRQITAFYKTPAGKKMVDKSPTLMGKSMQLGMQRVAKNQGELKQMIEDEAKKQKEKP
jgi:hypothetical protein